MENNDESGNLWNPCDSYIANFLSKVELALPTTSKNLAFRSTGEDDAWKYFCSYMYICEVLAQYPHILIPCIDLIQLG